MNTAEVYIHQVLEKLPAGNLRKQIEMDLRGHIADRLERGDSVDNAVRQLGDPTVLAESYLAAVPLVSAPFGRRLVAKLVDLLTFTAIPVAVLIVGMLTDFAAGGQSLSEPLDHPFIAIAGAVALLSILGTYVYIMIAEHRTGQTIGKRMFGLQVVTESGARISLGQSFLRQLPWFLKIFALDVLFALFTEKRQRAFELITRTRVVDLRGSLQSETSAGVAPRA